MLVYNLQSTTKTVIMKNFLSVMSSSP